MKKPVCYIVGASTFDEKIKPSGQDYVIACDGGYKFLSEQGVKIDCALGDFDSLGSLPNEENLIIYPSEKDETDMKIAVDYAVERGYEKLFIFGAVGGRLDHTIANIQTLLCLAKKNIRAYLFGEGKKITVINNSSFLFTGKEKGYFSVFALGGNAEGVEIKNAKYTVENQTLFCDNALGVSNEFIGSKSAEISVEKGSVCILWYENFTEGVGAENEN